MKLGWGRKRDGFEWREYVRTTILIKRKNRADRVAAAKDAAVDQLKDAAQRSADLGASGARAAKDGAKAVAGGAASWARRAAGRSAREAGAALGAVGAAVRAMPSKLGHLKRPALKSGSFSWTSAAARGFSALKSLPSAAPSRDHAQFLALVAGWGLIGAGAARMVLQTLDYWAVAMMLIGIALALYSANRWGAAVDRLADAKDAVGQRLRQVRVESLVPSGAFLKASAGATCAALIGAGAYTFALPSQTGNAARAPDTALTNSLAHLSWPSAPEMPSLSALNPFGASTETISGRAQVLSGDTLVIAGKTIGLDGVEAPERRQTCKRPGARRWRCGVAAERALQRLVYRKTVTCEAQGAETLGRRQARCTVGDADLGESLVKAGHVFAVAGLFAPYASLEQDAKARKVGIWRGSPKRPDDYRAQRWQTAKKKSPDGCPIKGRDHSRRGKIYVVPWSVSYERYRVRERRGDRWFCSEEEALSAGWKPLERS